MTTKIEDCKKLVEARVREEKLAFGENDDSEKEITDEFFNKCLNENQHGYGMLFAKLFKEDFIYNHLIKSWMIFNNHFWEKDVFQKALTAVTVAAQIFKDKAVDQSRIIRKALNDKGDKSEIKRLKKKKAAINKHANRLFSVKGRENCLEYARTVLNPLACSGEEFDKNPYLIACKNGVVDLKTGELRNGKPDDFISKQAPVNYPEDIFEEPVNFLKFLSEITEDKKGKKRDDWVLFLQRLLGTSLIGKRKERIFVVFAGARGQNGKGTIKDIMLHILGDLAWPIPSEMLLEQRFSKSAGGATPELMILKGTRFAVASETNENQKFSGAAVKLYSGGDPIPARAPYGKGFIKILPSHTLYLLSNHLPHMSGDDSAFWHRMIKISFEWSYVLHPKETYERKADIDLWDKLIKESDKIFGWLIWGALIYQKTGLDIPDSIKLEGLKYQRENDYLSDFLFDCCKKENGAVTSASDLYNAFVDWYKKNINDKEKYIPNQITFGKKLKLRFESFKRGITYYRDIRLLEPGEEPDRDELMEQLDNLDNAA
jgi:putative DNA primase/helicase